MTDLVARLMGVPSIAFSDGRSVELTSAKAQGLVCYLLVERQMHARDRLAGLFWPDVPERRAQASLRTALYDVRRALGPAAGDVLCVDRARIGITPTARVALDVSVIERVGQPGAADDADILRSAVDAYRGPFLDGVRFDDAPEAEDWVFLERERLDGLHATALCRLSERCVAEGRLDEASDLARRLLVIDPLREDVHRLLMRCYARSGNRTAALGQYAACAQALRRELDVEPLPATTELFQQIRDNRPLADESPIPRALARAAAVPSVPPRSVLAWQRGAGPLVGRQAPLRLLSAAWQSALDGEGALVLVTGEAGVGKTRLVAELAAGAHDRAFVLWGHCHESSIAEPYGPVVEAIRSALPEIDLAELELPTVWLRELARLVPELEADLPSGAPVPLDGVRERERLFESIRAFTAALTRHRPVLLVVEDVHWADDTSLSLLAYLARAPIAAGSLLVLTCRGEELGAERRSMVRGIARMGRLLELEPLSPSETAEMVRVVSGVDSAPHAFGAALHRATGGNAFFVVETVRALFEQGTLSEGAEAWATTTDSSSEGYGQLPIPESVGLIVSARLDKLSDDARHLLECAAVLRRRFGFDTVATMARVRPAEALDALDRLLEAGLVREIPDEAGALSPSYDFAHALVRDHVYSTLSGARRQYLHRQAAGLLEASGPSHADRIAYHYLRGGVRDRACQWSLVAGGEALAMHAGEAGLVHFRAARELAVTPAEEHGPLTGLGDAFVGLGRHAEAVKSFTAALATADGVEPRAELHRKIGRALERQGAFDRAIDAFFEARAALRGLPLSLTSIRVADGLATVYVRLGRYDEALELCGDALQWLERQPDLDGGREAEAWLRNTHGMALLHAGRFAAATDSLARSMQLKRDLGDRLGEATLANNLGVVAYHQGDDVAARQHYTASLAIKTEIGDTYGRAIALTNLALIETHLGRFDEAGRLLGDAERSAELVGAAWLVPEVKRVAAQRALAIGDPRTALSCALAGLEAAESLGVPSFIGVTHRVLGLVSAALPDPGDAVDEHFLTSLAVFEMLQNEHELAKTHAAYGQALLELGRRADAEPHLRLAAEVFERSGAAGRRERLEPLLGQ